MARILALGEVLIDFTPCGKSDAGKLLFECNPGGAPANMLSCLTQFGHTCDMVGCVGDDTLGGEIAAALTAAGIGTRYLKRSSTVPTTLAMVTLSEQGERGFAFYRDHGADLQISPADLPVGLLTEVDLVHVGALSLAGEPARSATLALLLLAQEAGVPISYDPNYRAPLFSNEATARQLMRIPLDCADIVKMSEEEAVFLTEEADAERAAFKLMTDYPAIAALMITYGAKGSAFYLPSGESGMVAPCTGATVVDTTGAGDYFMGGALAKLLGRGLLRHPTAELLRAACEQGNYCGYAVVQVRGALGVKIALPQIK